MPSINTKLLGEVVVTFPELEQQKRISGILSAIDSKIEVNQKINDNLEQQAATYFQELFINNANPVWQISTISDLGTAHARFYPYKAHRAFGLICLLLLCLYRKEAPTN